MCFIYEAGWTGLSGGRVGNTDCSDPNGVVQETTLLFENMPLCGGRENYT
jgi:hypothetical protein